MNKQCARTRTYRHEKELKKLDRYLPAHERVLCQYNRTTETGRSNFIIVHVNARNFDFRFVYNVCVRRTCVWLIVLYWHLLIAILFKYNCSASRYFFIW